MDTFKVWVNAVGGPKKAAEALTCSVPSIIKWNNGSRRPTPEMANLIDRVSGGVVRRESWYWPDRDISS